MLPLTDFIQSSYARVRAYLGRDAPLKASTELPLAESQRSDQAQFAQAQAFHHHGQLNEAEALYHALLLKHPEDFDLLHLLGMVQGQRGNFTAAVAFIEQAIAIDPDSAAAHGGLGNCLKGLGKYEAALASYDRALALRPDDADTWSNRGATLRDLQRPEQALESYDRALALNPHHVLALDNRGTTLRELQRPEEALASHDKALTINPDYALAHYNRGLALTDLKQLEAARASFERALALRPDYIDALTNLGAVLGDMARYAEALINYDRALTLLPNDHTLHWRRGVLLHNLKRFEDALACYDLALALRPDSIETLIRRGATLRELHRHNDALDAFDRVVELEPDHSTAHCYRGIVLDDMKRYKDALVSIDRALAFQPDSVEAHYYRGRILRQLRCYEEALTSYGNGLAINPDHLSSLFNRGNLLVYMARTEDATADYSRLVAVAPDYGFAQGHLVHAMMSCCDWRDLSVLSSAINEGVRQGKKSVEPFLFLGMSSSPELLKRCAEIYSAEKFPPATRKLFSGMPRHQDRIRLGYVAGEFRHHALSILMAGLFEGHDRRRFELLAFDNGWDDGSDIRKRLQGAFTQIVDISRLGDVDAASAIRDSGIDILIDLNAHSGFKRTGIFSHRPAPIQVNWLGYPGTMGVDYMDYIIGDAIVIPTGHEAYYSEKVVRLPDTYQVNDSRRVIAGRTPTRAEAKLPDSGFVFCCFNNNHKITPEVFDIWMRLLRGVAHSVLWLLEDNPAVSRNLRTEAAVRGVAPERLVFAPRLKLPDHLARHRLADLFLDTLPYNAHTTANDALWVGLPVLTCMGSTFAGRVAGSLLHAVGLPELVTENLVDYEALALKLATTPALLANLRTRLARNRTTHALFDSDRFRLHIESAYVTMYERWARGEAPASFTVNSVD